MANEISGTLRRQGWSAGAIHGDKKQEEREWVLGRKYKFHENRNFSMFTLRFIERAGTCDRDLGHPLFRQ